MKTASGIAFILLCLIAFSCKKEEPAPLPFADFLVENNASAAPSWLYFYDNSVNAVEWEWDFGNNFYSTSQNDSMLYSNQGNYYVKLIVRNTDGVEDSVTKLVYVY